MKKAILFFSLGLILFGGTAQYAQTVNPPYEVGTWRGFRIAAVSYTFDDNTPNQLPVAIPLFNAHGFKATLFTVTGWAPDWDGLRTAASQGHEVASHTVDHVRLNSLSAADQTYQYQVSNETIDSQCIGQKSLTIAYPNCRSGDVSICSQYFIAGRNCSGAIVPATPPDFYEINSYICGSRGSVKTIADFRARFNSAQTAGGWLVLLLHGIDNDGGYSPLSSTILGESLEYLSSQPNVFWVETFGNVVRYIKERNSLSVEEVASSGDAITLNVTDSLDDAIYNYPVTLRRPLPPGWSSVNATQGNRAVDSSIVMVHSLPYVMFDVIPDGGPVVLSAAGQTQAPAAPTGLTASAQSDQIVLDWNNNSESDLEGYTVYRSTSPGPGYEPVSGSLLNTSDYVDSAVLSGTTYFYVVTATNSGGYQSPYSNEASATLSGGGNATSMRLDSIVVTTTAAGGPNKKGRATVAMKDSNGNPVANATVTGTFSGTLNETRSGTTDATGTAVIQTNSFQKTIASLTFCVTNATHPVLVYANPPGTGTCESLYQTNP